MKRLRYIAAAAALAFISGCSGTKHDIIEKTPAVIEESAAAAGQTAAGEPEEYIPRSGLLKCSFFSGGSMAVWDNGAKEYPSDRRIMCGVVPHHLAAGRLIAGFFKAAAGSRSDVETVVVIATSHYGGESFYTSLSGWDSPFGVIKTNEDIVRTFCEKLGAVCDDGRMEEDHSASSHIPFIKHYFPDADAACLLVGANSVEDAPEKIAETLSGLPGADKCLFLFSIDFSHYLTPTQADMADVITREAAAERDYERIARFTNDNVDSPACLAAYLRLSDLLGLEAAEADNSNTVKINDAPYIGEDYPEGVTSYFIFISS